MAHPAWSDARKVVGVAEDRTNDLVNTGAASPLSRREWELGRVRGMRRATCRERGLGAPKFRLRVNSELLVVPLGKDVIRDQRDRAGRRGGAAPDPAQRKAWELAKYLRAERPGYLSVGRSFGTRALSWRPSPRRPRSCRSC